MLRCQLSSSPSTPGGRWGCEMINKLGKRKYHLFYIYNICWPHSILNFRPPIIISINYSKHWNFVASGYKGSQFKRLGRSDSNTKTVEVKVRSITGKQYQSNIKEVFGKNKERESSFRLVYKVCMNWKLLVGLDPSKLFTWCCLWKQNTAASTDTCIWVKQCEVPATQRSPQFVGPTGWTIFK